MGAVAARRLLAMMDGHEAEGVNPILPTSLVLRQSA
jgi:DNA-binding LacI/PurR family transcriptional regulator